jgi:hypothetical protein
MPPPSGGKPRLPEELLVWLMAEPEIGSFWTKSASEVAPEAR